MDGLELSDGTVVVADSLRISFSRDDKSVWSLLVFTEVEEEEEDGLIAWRAC